ncbi:MAG: ABC transporter ATP-binding protein [Chloroflexota bacterium]
MTNLPKTDLRVLLPTARWAWQLTWQTNRRLLSMITAVTVFISLVPAGLAFAVRGLVNAVAAVIANPATPPNEMIFWLLVGLGFTLLETVGNFAVDFYNQRLLDELNISVTTDILEHAAKLDVAQFEDPAFQDVLERARQGAAARFASFVNNALRAVTNILQIVTLTAVLMVIEPWVGAVLAVIAVPYLFFQWSLSKSRYKMGFHRTTNHRWTYYFIDKLLNNRNIPEVKLLGIAPLLIKQFKEIMVDFRDQNKQIYGRIFRGSSLFATISTVAFYATLLRVALRVAGGGLTIGDVAIYGGAMARLRFALEQAITAITDVLENSLHIANLRIFLDTEPELLNGGSITQGVQEGGSIEVRDLTFTYSGASKPTLKDVSLHINPGETVAIVGRNGAGKTTLVKLLARLYAGDMGQICFEGVDVRQWSTKALQQKIGFVFQQYGRYEATLADNIAYGNWETLEDDIDAIQEIAKRAKINDLLKKMPNGFDTFLGRMFGEYNLSGGQWQRLAIARAFARDASLLILDEPTSNMDAKAEFRLFSRFRDLAKGRTTILISHRFSTVSIADRILVMENGRIIESGSHQALVELGGTYAQLYDLHTRQMNQANSEK